MRPFPNKGGLVNHEKLECYKELMKTAEETAKGVAKWPRGYSYLADQLRRAMISAILNLCEGNGKRSSRIERRRFFEISLGSIAEVMASLDLAHTFGLLKQAEQERLKSLLKAAYVKINALP
jgi:four helix bundle protein